MAYKKLPPALDENQICEMIKAEIAPRRKNGGVYYQFISTRNAMMFFMAFTMGLRPNECMSIRVEDIDFNKKQLFIRGQNNKLRQSAYVPIPERVLLRLKPYIAFRTIFYNECEWLFPARNGNKQLDRSTFARIFRDNIKRIGIYKVNYVTKGGLNRGNFSPYSLRHGYGSHVFAKTGDIKKTQIAMRHKNISTTLKYIHIDEGKAREDIAEEVWN